MAMLLRLPLVEVSAKVRTGPPADEEEDYAREGYASHYARRTRRPEAS